MQRSGPTPTHWEQHPESLRNGPRRLVAIAASLSSTAHGRIACRVDNLSRPGCRVLVQCRFAAGTFLSLTFPDRSPLGARVVWSDGLRCGLEFNNPLHIAVLDDLLGLFQRGPDGDADKPRDLAHWKAE